MSFSLTSIGATQQLTATLLDQHGVLFTGEPASTTGGQLGLPSGGWMHTAAAVTALTTTTAQLAAKIRINAGALSGLTSNQQSGLWGIDNDGTGSNGKIRLIAAANSGPTNVQFSLKGSGFGSSQFGPTILISAFPSSGTILTIYSVYDTVNNVYGSIVFDASGNVIGSQFDSTTRAALGANGFVTVNSVNAATTRPACTLDGLAFYSAPLVASQQFTIATATDPALVYLCLMNDASSGATPTTAAAQVGTQGLVITGTPAWTTGGVWSGTAGTPITYASDTPAVATVNSSGLVTEVAAGSANFYGYIGQVVGSDSGTFTGSGGGGSFGGGDGSGIQSNYSDDLVEFMGVNTHFMYEPNPTPTAMVQQIANVGFRYHRDGGVDSGSNASKFLGFIDAVAALTSPTYKAIGCRQSLVSSVVYFPVPTTSVSFITNARAARIWAVEGPNEPDLSQNSQQNFQKYGGLVYPQSLVKYAHDWRSAINGGGSNWVNVKLMDPSPGQYGNMSQWTTGENTYGSNYSAYCDYNNFHTYAGGQVETNNYVPGLNDVKAIQGMSGLPVVQTEFGYNNNGKTGYAGQPGVSQRAKAKYTLRSYLYYYQQGLLKAFVYDMYSVDASNNGWSIGNATPPGLALAGTACQNYINLLADPTGGVGTLGKLNITFTGTTSNFVSQLVEKASGRFYLIMWYQVSSFNTSTQVDIETNHSTTVNFNGIVPTTVNLWLPTFNATSQQTWNNTLGSNAHITTPVYDHLTILEIIP
jgi:hypothetical protein